jgi:phosphoserine phosphatase
VTPRAKPRFASVVLDVDSTLCGLEGIDWLAQKRGAAVTETVTDATNAAMRGEIPLENVYSSRLSLVHPGRKDIEALAYAYMAALADGALQAVTAWRGAGIRVDLVSSGIRNSILPLASILGLPAMHVHAVDIQFDDTGAYRDFDRSSPLTTAMGKREIVRTLALPRPTLAVGDGITDLAMRESVDAFAAFTGFVSRPLVIPSADFVVNSFAELDAIVSATE